MLRSQECWEEISYVWLSHEENSQQREGQIKSLRGYKVLSESQESQYFYRIVKPEKMRKDDEKSGGKIGTRLKSLVREW